MKGIGNSNIVKTCDREKPVFGDQSTVMSCGLTTKITVSASATATVSTAFDPISGGQLMLPLQPAVSGDDLIGMPTGS